jgi:kynurenine formamidase
MLRSLGIAAGAAALSPLPFQAAEPRRRYSFEQVIDLTHTLGPDFPSPWKEPFGLQQISKLGPDKWNIFRWHLNEHIGTHLDAPLHCTNLDSADKIPAQQLIGPLIVVDIRKRVARDPDCELTLEDLEQWEKSHHRIPDGAIVAMFSGWDAYVKDARKFLGLDASGQYHLPGFSLEAVRFLHEQRKVKGIATDTLNLDPASAGDFPVHHYWLGQNKWGLENVANLGQVPSKGATVVVGSPKIAGCTGGPSRVFALL